MQLANISEHVFWAKYKSFNFLKKEIWITDAMKL